MYLLLSVIIGYFLGNISTSYIVGKLSKKIDIRQHGSGNAGATNTLRVLGAKAGLVVFAIDVLKGAAAVLIGSWLAGDMGAMLAGAASVIGHNWPVFLGFKGGKGVATSFGVLLVMFPLIAGILLVICAALVSITRYMSLGSIVAGILLPLLLIIFAYPSQLIFFGVVLGALTLYRHRGNISRLLAGKESKLGNRANLR